MSLKSKVTLVLGLNCTTCDTQKATLNGTATKLSCTFISNSIAFVSFKLVEFCFFFSDEKKRESHDVKYNVNTNEHEQQNSNNEWKKYNVKRKMHFFA